MKFQHLILACAIAAFTLPACSSSDKDEDSESKKSEKEELSSDVITEEYCFVPKTEDEIKEAKEIQRQKKLEEKWVARAENVLDYFEIKANKVMAPYKNLEFGNMSMQEQKRISQEIQDIQQSFIKNYGAKLVEKANKIKEGYEKDCPDLETRSTVPDIGKSGSPAEDDGHRSPCSGRKRPHRFNQSLTRAASIRRHQSQMRTPQTH